MGVKDSAAVAAAELEIAAGRDLDVLGRAACRLAARLSVRIETPDAKDDPLKLADALSRVAALLPSRPEVPPLDLSLLTDEQLSQLKTIVAIGRGETPPTPEPEPEQPEQTPRHYYASVLCTKLDAVEQAGFLADADKGPIIGAISSLLPKCVGTPTQFFGLYLRALGDAPSASEKAAEHKSEAGAVPSTAEITSAPAAAPNNVTPISQAADRVSADGAAYGFLSPLRHEQFDNKL
jgi:hypothetical protein